MNLDFNNVELPQEGGNVNVVVAPGVKELTIQSVKLNNEEGRTASLTFELVQEGIQYPMFENFYLSPKALPRLKYFYETLTGEKAVGNFTTDNIIAKMTGIKATYLVNGKEVLKEKDGKSYVNIRAELPFTGFINPAKDTAPYIKPLPAEDTAVTGTGVVDDFAITPTPTTTDDMPF